MSAVRQHGRWSYRLPVLRLLQRPPGPDGRRQSIGRASRTRLKFNFAKSGQSSQNLFPMKIALDAMGGDFGPLNLVARPVIAPRDPPPTQITVRVDATTPNAPRSKKHT